MIVNLQRDGLWLPAKTDNDSTWSAESLLVASTFKCNAGDATVYDAESKVKGELTTAVTVTGGYWKGIGCYIKQPTTDTVPYRVKAYAGSMLLAPFALGIGYAPASITGTDDVITEAITIPFDTHIDQLFMLPALDDQDSLYDRAICFAILMGGTTADYPYTMLSVQRLATSPPQFAQSTP